MRQITIRIRSPSTIVIAIGVAASLLMLVGVATTRHARQPADNMVGAWAYYATPGDDASITGFLIIDEPVHGSYPVTMYGKECGQDEFTPGARAVLVTRAFEVTGQQGPNPAADAILYFGSEGQACGHALAPGGTQNHAEVNLEWYSNQNRIVLDVTGEEYVPFPAVQNIDDAADFFDRQTRDIAAKFKGEWIDPTGSPETLVVFDDIGHYRMTGGFCVWDPLLDFGWFGVAAPGNKMGVPSDENTFSIVGTLTCPDFPDGWEGFEITYELNEGIKTKYDTLIVHPEDLVLARK